ncbi:hypothetical protein [Pyramidobacter sp. C12-8]|uniref:hypothetical protein n=1 Tax=Pyramidobacter sp. C12-8 TaxID=1943580 RepID=UPI00098F7022|nr:hypothetical protein [Pyramidobacter sp. C12-8]OON89107.1 hypothetical protein B0D78_05760 [Pyramidobacter sp. C12-8]
MMIHGVKLEERSWCSLEMLFPDGSSCAWSLAPQCFRNPRLMPLDPEAAIAPSDADRFTGRFGANRTPEDKEIDEAALKLLYSSVARSYLNGELDIKPSA